MRNPTVIAIAWSNSRLKVWSEKMVVFFHYYFIQSRICRKRIGDQATISQWASNPFSENDASASTVGKKGFCKLKRAPHLGCKGLCICLHQLQPIFSEKSHNYGLINQPTEIYC